MSRGLVCAALAAIGVVIVAAAAVVWLNLRDEGPLTPDAGTPASAEQIARGAYLARAGNCQGCHTERGGVAYAGGRGVPTPFGTVYAPNLTPDRVSGLGDWTAAEFWRALHNGRARDGRLLYPAFPYPNYTRVARADSDAIFAYLRSLPPAATPNRAHALRFPFNQPAALAVWRALYFRPAQPAADAARSTEWNRGAYLVEGLGHCNACHASRNALGATPSPLDLAGGMIPVQNWYAPSLASPRDSGGAEWSEDELVALLGTGLAPRGAVMGPMSEVVSRSTQHLSVADLRAIAAYLKALRPATADAAVAEPSAHASAPVSESANDAASPGARLYGTHCADCHGDQGEGVRGIYPALAGSRTVSMQTPANLVHLVLEGGFPPATAGNPRPFGMPPFATVLSDDEVAQVLTYIRTRWGNQAAPVSGSEAGRYRGTR